MDGFELTPEATKRRRKAIPKFKPSLVKRAKRTPEPPKGPVRMRLGVCHYINGTRFGPGVVDVPAEYVNAIHGAEKRNADEERKLREPRAAIIGRGGRVHRVDPSFFDSPDGMEHAPVAG